MSFPVDDRAIEESLQAARRLLTGLPAVAYRHDATPSMDLAIVVALIALAGSVISTAVSFYGQARTRRLDAAERAEATLARYREPLVAAAFELQSRLFNILRQDFLGKYYVNGTDEQQEYAVKHTLYVVGQFFGWIEILRRQIEFLNFGEVEETRDVSNRVLDIRDLFASDKANLGTPFMIWRGAQRAIGERMMTRDGDVLVCMGYAEFSEQTDPSFKRWFEQLERDIEAVSGHHNERLRLVQHALIDLIERLDANGVRFPKQIERA